ncbi:cellulose binding domain-containing protein [Actinomadura xylanilytica]|uniref:cellulose binding domain-containing protein n=1 Tax=Actinomadura xylanilytica TaxID=887459 RepID=UPI00255B0E64|nr:cellulose binding domain-containing protein [Actinomadura xylanilytica]MDL4771674.1 cellulose binding domain-containing protein [Actinomadura xylanilytica]
MDEPPRPGPRPGPRSEAPAPFDPGPGAPQAQAPYAAPTPAPTPPAAPPSDPLTTSPFDPAEELAFGPSDELVFSAPVPSAPSGPAAPYAETRVDTFSASPPGTPLGPPPGSPPGPPSDEPPPEPPSARRSGASTRGTWSKAFVKLPVPLLPIVALVVAVGVVAYALSTQQISLNFAGGAPKEPQTGPKDSQVSQRNPKERASRGAHRADGLVVAFRRTSSTATGFRATVTIANRGQRPVPRWALAFTIPNVSVRTVSGAAVVKTGRLTHVRSKTGTGPLVPGESVKIAFTATGKAAGPSSCILNRLACARV